MAGRARQPRRHHGIARWLPTTVLSAMPRSLADLMEALKVQRASDVILEPIPATVGSGPVTTRAQAEESRKASERREGVRVARSSSATIRVTREEARMLLDAGAKDAV